MHEDSVYELASDLYFYFIDYLDIRDKCVIEMDDYTENTDLGREIYYLIEDAIIKERWSLLKKENISKQIKSHVKHYIKKRLH